MLAIKCALNILFNPSALKRLTTEAPAVPGDLLYAGPTASASRSGETSDQSREEPRRVAQKRGFGVTFSLLAGAPLIGAAT